MTQTQLSFEEESQVLSPLQKLSLPKDKDLPPVIREIVTNAPKNRKLASFIASLSPLCALCPRVRLKYCYDRRQSALLLQVIIEGAQSSGKSYAADIESLIMDNTLKARDKEMRRLEQEYREKKKRRKANERLEEEPQTTIRVIPPTISKTVLTKRADMFDRVWGDTMTFWMFAEELAMVCDAGKSGYSNLRTIMRTAYDLGSLFGIDFASDNSYSAIVDINICTMFCATPSAVDAYFDKESIDGGNISRCILYEMEESLGDDGAIFKPYTEAQMRVINSTLQQLMDATYTPDGMLQPTIDLDMSWIDQTVKHWMKSKGMDASKCGSDAIHTFRKRASVNAFRVASLCYYLYQLEQLSNEQAQKRTRQIYLFMAEYLLEATINRWGKRYTDSNNKRKQDNKQDKRPVLFDTLPEEFSRELLKEKIIAQGLTTPVREFICMWKSKKLIQIIDKNTCKKC